MRPRKLTLRQRKLLLIAVGAPIGLLCGFALLFLVFGLYWPAGSENVGNFTISHRSADFMGHKGHRSTIHYRQPWKDLLVSSRPLNYILDPRNPQRIIYSEYCDEDADQTYCGVVYFDGATRHKWKIAPVGRRFVASLVQWTPDGSYAMLDLDGGQEIVFVDLERGTVTGARITINPEPPPWYAVRFKGWSPDFRSAAVIVSNQWREGPDASYDYDLHWVDPAASSVTYVRTFSEADMRGGAFEWAAEGGSYRPVSDKGSVMLERALPNDR